MKVRAEISAAEIAFESTTADGSSGFESARHLDAFGVGIAIAYGAVLAVHGDVPLLEVIRNLGLIP